MPHHARGIPTNQLFLHANHFYLLLRRHINHEINFIQGDILNQLLIEDLVKNIDYVVHLAASLGVFTIINKPLASLKTNLTGTEWRSLHENFK